MSTRTSEEQRLGIPAAPDARALISLPQIAALARVQRPVVSVWRARFASGTDAFPTAVTSRAGQELFDALEIANWLIETSHGKNPDALEDAAAFSSASDDAPVDAEYEETVEALLALRVADGVPLTVGELSSRARRADPDDAAFKREIEALVAGSTLPAFVERMIDAAYSPAGAYGALRAQTASRSADGSAGPIAAAGADFVARLTQSIVSPGSAPLVDAPGALSSGELLATASDRLGDAVELHVPAEARTIRRRLIIHDRAPMLASDLPSAGMPAVWLARLRGDDAAAELAQLEDLLVDLSDRQRLIVVGPDAMLTEPLAGPAAVSREFLLRSGRVRGIVRLPAGLVPSAVRQSLAVWLIGEPQGRAALADRFTVIGDLRGVTLTSARTHDLITDLAASLGTAREALAHAFRFAHFVRTSTLIAAAGSLVAASRPQRAARSDPAETTALIDQKLSDLGNPDLMPALLPSTIAPPPDVLLDEALDAREARLIAGTRLDAAHTNATDGYPVIGRDEVRAQAASNRRIDRVVLALEYPRAQLTLPGDVIVLSGARPAALVDPDGSSIVEYPARILRLLDDALAPEVVAADINALGSAVPLRRWVLRRVSAGQKAVLREALAGIVTARWDAERRASALAELEALVTDAVAAGALADAGPAHQALTSSTTGEQNEGDNHD
ncbi:hypothetical protein WDU99_02905 [Microbacterium sp. Mu-80]|uniref:Uncharacterized protein n=1 Tax=Microbacterium bandirmense TaxID=3122050 RepID=A0ABU8L813_9MICO